ncbi:uncharacterized protein LOC121520634 isoform X2 [Cheilinus undulatus]|uniref:uncharacterized protein LOC121520634 isoform X2 n=1 Tax=Cheilinus undulatus TaxID=241271 RepID=UPI001BD30476|nr:uncharacterized protein LOC121520634 isoform X2 [Cheilinus undulatus]
MEDPTQSAVKYVKDAWLKLVNELKDLDVILDNLNVHGVFTKEEVSVVQKEKNEYEERRTLLRKITDKGEKACYKFLKTIASMCKRNSGRLSSPTKKKPDASTEDEEFDLQKWISGFSFKSEQTENYYSQGPRSCCRYQEKLKSKALKKSKKFWMGDRSLFQETYRPDLSYTPLVLDTQGGASASKIKKLKNKKCKKSRPKKLQTYLPEDDLGISPSELLKTQRDILIVGKPGIGKTALSHEILKLWAERDSRELDYMFYFDIRETSHIRDGISLEELLFSEYCEPDEDKEKVSEDIKKYSDNVTIIFDGITDLSSSVVRKIVDGDLLPYAKVIITCRPDDEEEFLPGDFLRVEVKGFNEQTIEKYFSTMLGVDQNKIFSNVELLTLCHVPLYALMVAACFLSETPEDSSQPCSMTEIYINIVRHCLQLNSKTNKKHLNSFIKEKRAELLSLAEAAFHATERKTVSLTDLQCDDSCVLSFLKPLFVQVAPTETTTSYFFLHYTVQEFFAAVWLLKNPDQIKIVFQQCLTEEGKHMKHLIPFMCRLLTKKSPSLMEYLIPVEELNNISDWFFKEMISTFFSAQCMNDEADTEDTGLDESVLFLCQCLFESQSPEACTNFLETLDYQLDLSGEILDSYLCCAVAYVVAQSKERKIQLNLEDASVSEQGMRQLYGCLNNVHWCDPLPRQLWEMVLLSEGQLSNVDLLSLDGNQMHLPVQGKRQLFKRAVSVMKNIPKRINVCLHWDNGATTVSQSLCEALLEALPFVTSLSFRMTHNSPGLEDQESDPRTLERKKKKLLLDLCLKAALDEDQSFHHVVHQLVSMFSVDKHLHNFFVDFYEHVKNKGCSSVRPKLDPLFKSAPKVWSINLSEINTSILLEVLKLLKKTKVNLTGYSDEGREVRSFLQCLPYISHLSFSDWSDSGVKFCGSLFCAAATTERELQSGENTLELLSSVCRHQTFPFIDDDDDDDYRYTQCNFFLDLYSHIKNYETKTGSSVLQPLQSFFTSDQTVWSVDLSERKTSILLEVLKLQTEKIHVELRGWSDEESEVRNFLHCLPYISKLSFSGWSDSGVKFCGSLFCAAATTERELQSGENTLELLSSVCRHQTSPFIYHNYEYTRCDFFLDLYSHIKNYETQIGSSVLQPLQSFFISDQTEWSVDLSERKTSILLEVLKLQTEKIHVELRGWSDEESEVRNFLHCLPYISKLSCYDQEFFQCVCTSISVRSRDEAEHLVHLLQLLGFTLHLTGKLTSKTCKTVGRVLGLCGSHVDLNLTPSAMSVRGASLLFRHVKTLHSLRLSNSMALLLSGWVRRQEVPCLTVTEQLSLAPQWGPSSERVSLRVVSSLASLLRYWTIRQLDLTESSIPAQSLSSLLFHDGPLKIKLHESLSQQLLNLLCETQDDDFTSAFLRKVNGDLTPFSLNWELLHRLLQLSSQTLTVNLRKNRFLQRSITPLLPFLDRIVFKRPSPRFVLTTIREIYATRSSSVVLSFLRSFDHVISLTCREMDSDDCAALLFTLKHCDGVKLNLLWTSIPTEEIRSILCALDNVSQLSVDRNLLLKLVHCCAASGDLLTTADSLLRALQHRLDLSRSSCAELSEEGQSETLRLTVADCKAVSTVLTRSSSWDTATELHLQDCEVEDSGLDLLFSVLDRVRLRASKVILLQLVALIPLDSMRRAEYLCKALDGELDLSNTELDQGACQALACMLEFSEGLKELDLSYCQLTNQLLHTIKDHLHKVQVLDLSHNKITDASTYTLLGLISNNSSIETVRLFRNNIKHQTLLKTVKKFEIW